MKLWNQKVLTRSSDSSLKLVYTIATTFTCILSNNLFRKVICILNRFLHYFFFSLCFSTMQKMLRISDHTWAMHFGWLDLNVIGLESSCLLSFYKTAFPLELNTGWDILIFFKASEKEVYKHRVTSKCWKSDLHA